jgi:vitamin B12 transporter
VLRDRQPEPAAGGKPQPQRLAGRTDRLGGGELRWKATYFNRRITDLIDYDYDDPAFPNGIAVNVADRVKAQGGEAELSASLPGGWSLSASYTYARVRNRGSRVQRDRNPEQYAKGVIAYAPDDRPFGATASVNWTGDAYSTPSGFGRRNYGDYALVDLGFWLYPDGAARRHRFAVNVENLFDREYATRGIQSAVSDGGVLDGSNRRFLYFARGVPRTLRVSYGVGF